ncbi:MAG TPA: hypothetical protein VMS64_25045 [Candidatus Methylomirabilis sp.]|nr:hypothetical protein [Candidatus Methylomirabilis sp.]
MGVNGLGLTRSLGEVGIPVTAVATGSRWAPELHSRYCDALVWPSPVTEPERLLELLLTEGRKLQRPGVLLPANDSFVLFLSRYRAQLASRFVFALPAPSVSEALADKRRQYEMAERAGIPCPQTFHLKTSGDVETIKNALQYPAFLKPCVSALWAPVFRVKGFRIEGPADLEGRLAEVASSGLDVIVQAIVPGPNVNLLLVRVYLDANQRLLALYTQRKVRQYPIDFGDATLCESIRAEDVAALGTELLRRIAYHGLASTEFKRDERTGELKLIEINPRLGQNNILNTRCGVNFPLIAYLDLTGQKPEPVVTFREGVRYLVVGKDVRAFAEYRRRGELGLVAWIRSLASVRAFPFLDCGDPVPFLMAMARGLWQRLRHFRDRRGHGVP